MDTCIEISKELAMDNEIATLGHHRFELYLSGCSPTEQKSHAGIAEESFTRCYRDSLMLRCHPSLQQGVIPSISHSHSTLAVAVLAPHSYITPEMHSEMCKLVWWQHIQCYVEDTGRMQNFVAALTCHYAVFLTTWKLEWSQAGFIRTTLYTQTSYFFHLS